MIDGGADPNRGRAHIDVAPHRVRTAEYTPLCYATHIGWAFPEPEGQQRVDEVMQALLDGGADLLKGDMGVGSTALHCAAWFPGTAVTVRFLVQAADKAEIHDFVNRARDDGSETPLCAAAATPNGSADRSLAVVRELLRLGARPNGNESGRRHWHPLLCAQTGRDRVGDVYSDVDGGAERYDAIIETLLAAGAVWPAAPRTVALLGASRPA